LVRYDNTFEEKSSQESAFMRNTFRER